MIQNLFVDFTLLCRFMLHDNGRSDFARFCLVYISRVRRYCLCGVTGVLLEAVSSL